MACSALIKGTLLVALGLIFVKQTSAVSGRCPNRNSAPNQCNCEVFNNNVDTAEGAAVVDEFTVTSEEFRPRVVGRRPTKNDYNFIIECESLCFNHLRAKLRQPNVVADTMEKSPPTSGFLTTTGKDNLCDLIFNASKLAAVTGGAFTTTANDETLYYFLRSSRRGCPLESTLAIGATSCECYRWTMGTFERCYSAGGPDPSAATRVLALL